MFELNLWPVFLGLGALIFIFNVLLPWDAKKPDWKTLVGAIACMILSIAVFLSGPTHVGGFRYIASALGILTVGLVALYKWIRR
jgi:hypothetical protein